MGTSRPLDDILINIFRRAKITASERKHIDRLISNLPRLSYFISGPTTSPFLFPNSYREAVFIDKHEKERRRGIKKKQT